MRLWQNWLSYREIMVDSDDRGRLFESHCDLFIDGYVRENNGKVLPLVINIIIVEYEGRKWKRPRPPSVPSPLSFKIPRVTFHGKAHKPGGT